MGEALRIWWVTMTAVVHLIGESWLIVALPIAYYRWATRKLRR
jgi:hypothetical protein